MAERNKGKSLLSVVDDYTIVDLETTGFSAEYNHIIEVGCIKFRNGVEIERYQSLVKPPEPIPYVIECMTGIHNEDVANSATFSDIGMEIWNFLKDEVVVGHNINFDINFLYDNFQRVFQLEFQNDFIDTLRLSRMLLPDIRKEGCSGYSLVELCNYFDIAVETKENHRKDIVNNALPQLCHHRAIPDCQMTHKVFSCLKEIIIRDKFDLKELTKRLDYRHVIKNLRGEEVRFDTEHVFFDKCCVFTGKLERFTRVEAAQIVANIGGRCEDTLTKRTNFLIVGDMDYKKGLEGYESNKLKKAKKLVAAKQNLQILPESAFYDLVADYLEE